MPREPHQSLLMPMKMRHPSLRVHAGGGMVRSAPELYGPSKIFFATIYCVCVFLMTSSKYSCKGFIFPAPVLELFPPVQEV